MLAAEHRMLLRMVIETGRYLLLVNIFVKGVKYSVKKMISWSLHREKQYPTTFTNSSNEHNDNKQGSCRSVLHCQSGENAVKYNNNNNNNNNSRIHHNYDYDYDSSSSSSSYYYYTLYKKKSLLSLSGNSGRLTWVMLQQPQEQRCLVLQVHVGFVRVSVIHQTLTWLQDL